MPSLLVHEPVIDSSVVWCKYTHQNEQYQTRFKFDTPLDSSDPTLQRLLRWTSTMHALYLFDFEYFTQVITDFPLDASEQKFLEKLAYNGMAEFRQVNRIPMATATTFAGAPASAPAPQAPLVPKSGTLLLNGGGKDGCVSAALLEDAGISFTWFMLNSSVAQDNVARASGVPTTTVKRLLDQRRPQGKYHGHCPTSAAIALCATTAAYVSGKAHVVTSNEQSANEDNGLVDGVAVNHQYSKSLEFERDFNALLSEYNVGVDYFSLLRPLHELQVVQIMTQTLRYIGAFVSCNHGFKRGEWCLQCAKCAFVALTFTAIAPATVANIWGDELVINRPALLPFLEELLDPALQKPLECVGTLEECQLAAGLIMEGPLAPKLSDALRTVMAKHASSSNTQAAQSLLRATTPEHAIPPAFASALAIMQRHFPG